MTGILEGKVALVTGGASGIGRATAVVMARGHAKLTSRSLDGGTSFRGRRLALTFNGEAK